MPDHEPCWRADRDGYLVAYVVLWGVKCKMSKHRWVMSHHLGRYLREGEVVHHINGVRGDCGIENLELRTRGDHPPGQSVAEMLRFCRDYIRDHGP